MYLEFYISRASRKLDWWNWVILKFSLELTTQWVCVAVSCPKKIKGGVRKVRLPINVASDVIIAIVFRVTWSTWQYVYHCTMKEEPHHINHSMSADFIHVERWVWARVKLKKKGSPFLVFALHDDHVDDNFWFHYYQ